MLRREKERHFTPWTRSLRLISADDMIHYTGLPHGCRCFPCFHLPSLVCPCLSATALRRYPFQRSLLWLVSCRAGLSTGDSARHAKDAPF